MNAAARGPAGVAHSHEQIGARGAFINKIKQSSSCVIEVPKDTDVLRAGGTDGTKVVCVAGARPELVARAEQVIAQKLDAKQACVSTAQCAPPGGCGVAVPSDWPGRRRVPDVCVRGRRRAVCNGSVLRCMAQERVAWAVVRHRVAAGGVVALVLEAGVAPAQALVRVRVRVLVLAARLRRVRWMRRQSLRR